MWFKPVKLSGVTADTVTGADLMSDTVPGADFRPGSLESALHWQVIWPRIKLRPESRLGSRLKAPGIPWSAMISM